ncbi:hypothetical protein AW25_3 [Francisella tularensis subsp. novicida U112]|nr:hypothetical protein AW25_3 [Francisella tularensis subsp. novicida U112]
MIHKYSTRSNEVAKIDDFRLPVLSSENQMESIKKAEAANPINQSNRPSIVAHERNDSEFTVGARRFAPS